MILHNVCLKITFQAIHFSQLELYWTSPQGLYLQLKYQNIAMPDFGKITRHFKNWEDRNILKILHRYFRKDMQSDRFVYTLCLTQTQK